MIVPVVVFDVLCDGCGIEKSAPRAQDYWCAEEIEGLEESLAINDWARNRTGTRHWCSYCVADGYGNPDG